MDLYGAMLGGLLYPAWERGVRRRPVLRYVDELARTERAPLPALRALQQRRLGRLATHAAEHVPFYRERFAEAGLAPASLTLETLARLPVLTRREAADSAEARRSLAPPFATIAKTTGGTTGEPLAIRYDLGSEHWRQAVKLRGYGWAGYRIGDPVLHYWGVGTRPDTPARQRAKVWLDHALKREVYVDCTPRGEAHLAETVALIAERRPRVMICYAQAGADLARYVVETGSRAWDDIAVITGAEALLDADRAAFEQAFGPQVCETYGCREFMLIGIECAARSGLHVSMENLIVEIVVTEHGRERPARAGETGEVVLTDLHNHGMPFIRYANGDVATAGTTQRCTCGRTLPRIRSVQGRISETLHDADTC
jgi:phenylacetate-CoA ligase